MTRVVRLPRSVIEVAGEDRVGFLQGLVSNDVALAAPGSPLGRCVWAALLTPQGKWLADFFIFAEADRLLLDCEAAQVATLVQRLSRFRLRSRVTVRVVEDLAVYAGLDGADEGIAAPDPRLAGAGWRMLGAPDLADTAGFADWDWMRLGLGLPDGSRDLEAEKTVLLEAGFDELNGVSWSKGCYMGQELTARTKYRGLVKRRLVPVVVRGPAPVSGTQVLRNGAEAGVMRSSCGDLGLALLRLDGLAGPLACADARLEPRDSRLDAASGASSMSKTQAIEWEDRYQAGTTRWERGAVNPAFLAWRASGALSPCRILVPGAGRSPEPGELARAGFEVTVLDVAPSAVAFQRERLGDAGQVVEFDLFAWNPEVAFDAVYDQTCLCALRPELLAEYEARLARWVRSGGGLFVLFMQTGKEGGPPFDCPIPQMRELFAPERWVWPDELGVPVAHAVGIAEQPAVLRRR